MLCPKCGHKKRGTTCQTCGFVLKKDVICTLQENSDSYMSSLAKLVRGAEKRRPDTGIRTGGTGDKSTEEQTPKPRTEDFPAAAHVSEMINRIGIGKVELTEHFGYLIGQARIFYDGLSDKEKEYVEHYSWLTRAESEYARLQEKADQRRRNRIRTISIIAAIIVIGSLFGCIYFSHKASTDTQDTPSNAVIQEDWSESSSSDKSWGPERATFTMDSPATYPIFNSIIDNPTIGDERAFVRIGKISDESTELQTSVQLEDGERYLVYIYYHNNASETYNGTEQGQSGIALNVRLSSSFPSVVSEGTPEFVSAVLTADNSDPESIWAQAELYSNSGVIYLRYVEGSAKIYNDGGTNKTELSEELFNSSIQLGFDELNGVIPGCEEYHGVVTYVLQADTTAYGEDATLVNGMTMEQYLKAADAGDANAMTQIGTMYFSGEGVDQDFVKAMEWWQKAAAAGDARAMNYIGNLYYDGRGVERDYNKAMEWYRKAVDAGNARAMSYIGHLYSEGRGVEQDYRKAMEWWQKAAAAGDAYAMYCVGNLYYNGRGVDQDSEKAMEWYQKAADAGSDIAQRILEQQG